MHTSPRPALPGSPEAAAQAPLTGRHYQPRHRAERPSHRPVARRLAAGALTGVALGGSLTALAPAAPALADSGRGSAPGVQFDWAEPGEKPVEVPRGEKVVDIAASKAGTPYAYGATGPGSFDCSGFTSWVYARVGRTLPRTSSAQAGATQRIAARDARPGDLVFFTGGSGVYHVGIYAGAGAVWHSPRPGEGVQRSRIWTSSVFYGRVR